MSSQEFASQFGLTIFFICEKHLKLAETVSPARVLFEITIDRPLIASNPSKRDVNCVAVGRQRPIDNLNGDGGVCVCDVFAIYDQGPFLSKIAGNPDYQGDESGNP